MPGDSWGMNGKAGFHGPASDASDSVEPWHVDWDSAATGTTVAVHFKPLTDHEARPQAREGTRHGNDHREHQTGPGHGIEVWVESSAGGREEAPDVVGRIMLQRLARGHASAANDNVPILLAEHGRHPLALLGGAGEAIITWIDDHDHVQGALLLDAEGEAGRRGDDGAAPVRKDLAADLGLDNTREVQRHFLQPAGNGGFIVLSVAAGTVATLHGQLFEASGQSGEYLRHDVRDLGVSLPAGARNVTALHHDDGMGLMLAWSEGEDTAPSAISIRLGDRSGPMTVRRIDDEDGHDGVGNSATGFTAAAIDAITSEAADAADLPGEAGPAEQTPALTTRSVPQVSLLDGGGLHIVGTQSADLIIGSAKGDRIEGGAGDDTIVGGSGSDTLTGGSGRDLIDGDGRQQTSGPSPAEGERDTLSYEGETTGLLIDMSDVPAAIDIDGDGEADVMLGTVRRGTDGAAPDDTTAIEDIFRNIEDVIGGAAGDVILGDAEANQLDGREGDDTIAGGGGDDTLIGGTGTDVVTYASVRTAYVITAFDQGYRVRYTAGGTGDDGTDLLFSIEMIYFADGQFRLASLITQQAGQAAVEHVADAPVADPDALLVQSGGDVLINVVPRASDSGGASAGGNGQSNSGSGPGNSGSGGSGADPAPVVTAVNGIAIAPTQDANIAPVDNGYVVMRNDGNLLFVPDEGYVGPAMFNYTTTDAAGASSVADVALAVVETSGPQPNAVGSALAAGLALGSIAMVPVEAANEPVVLPVGEVVAAAQADAAAAMGMTVTGEASLPQFQLAASHTVTLGGPTGIAVSVAHVLDVEVSPSIQVRISTTLGVDGGTDTVSGMLSIDTINSGVGGQDTLSLSFASDNLEFNPGFGNDASAIPGADTTADAQPAVVDLTNSAYENFQQLRDAGALTQVGDDVVISLDAADPNSATITLKSVNVSALQEDAFKFQ